MMRKKAIGLVMVGLIGALSIAPAQAQRAVSTTITTIPMGASAKALDQANQPPAWQALDADETGWDAVTPVSADVRACLAQQDSAWTSAPTYWGADESRDYVFRFTFTAPPATNYYDSNIRLSAPSSSNLYLNGHYLGEALGSFGRVVVAPYLQPGKNVLAIATVGSAPLRTAAGLPCAAVSATVELHANGVTPAPAARPAASAGPLLRLSWPRVPGAAYYYLQVWLTQAASGQAVSAGSRSSVAVQTSTANYTLDAHGMPSGRYQWRAGAVMAHGELISWSAPKSATLK